jgi:hypothetical protein
VFSTYIRGSRSFNWKVNDREISHMHIILVFFLYFQTGEAPVVHTDRVLPICSVAPYLLRTLFFSPHNDRGNELIGVLLGQTPSIIVSSRDT